MQSEHENSETSTNRPPPQPAPSPRQRLIDTLVWVVLPLAFAVALAIKYWPR